MLFGHQGVHKKHWTPVERSITLTQEITILQMIFEQVEVNMADEFRNSRKLPTRATLAPEERLLVGRDEAAQMLSISRRALDYLVANRELQTRRIGKRVLIPVAALKLFSRVDHPRRLAG
jgi:excisionase family DNA binding protein